MDKELKPPYIPPKDKIISDKEVNLMNSKAKSVTEEILVYIDQVLKTKLNFFFIF